MRTAHRVSHSAIVFLPSGSVNRVDGLDRRDCDEQVKALLRQYPGSTASEPYPTGNPNQKDDDGDEEFTPTPEISKHLRQIGNDLRQTAMALRLVKANIEAPRFRQPRIHKSMPCHAETARLFAGARAALAIGPRTYASWAEGQRAAMIAAAGG